MRGIFSANNKVGQEFTFKTNSSSGATFDPTIVMGGSKRASWNLGEGGSYFAGNSVSYTYPNSSLKTIKIRTNRLTDITSLDMVDDNLVGVLNLTGFTNCTTFSFNANSNLTGVTLPTTSTSVGSIRFGFCNLYGSLNITNIPNFYGSFYIPQNPNLTGLTLPSSSTNVFTQFVIDSCNIYGRIDLSGYTNLGGQINLSYNTNITGVTFPNSSQSISQFYIGNNNFTHDLIISGLTGLGGGVQLDGVKSANIIFPSSSNSINYFNINSCYSLTSADLTTLSGIGGTVILQGNTALTSYNLTRTSNSITYLAIGANYSLTNLNLNPLSGVTGSAFLNDNTSLTNLTLPSVYGGPVTSIDIRNCNLPASGVNYVLYSIDSTGWTGGTLNISGGGNSAPNGTAGGYNGTAATLSLIAKSWSVTTN